jgi:hypothetical protein
MTAEAGLRLWTKPLGSPAMNRPVRNIVSDFKPLDPLKFCHPDLTAKGEVRARVPLQRLDTLWINTGTLCNITCLNCYIESSPANDRLAYFRIADALALYDEIAALGLGTREIGFTGGEPFLNPDMLAMAEAALERGFSVLVLTNALQPMQRPRIKAGLVRLRDRFGARLTLRVSLDHYAREHHESERGFGTWKKTLSGLDWLAAEGFSLAIAGRTCWGEDEAMTRAGYARLIAAHGWTVDAFDASRLVLFPEMDTRIDVPEITTACWGILDKRPSDVMCASSRMAVLRKGEERPVIMPCTLLPYDPAFAMGHTLAEMLKADGGNFERGSVKLNHPHCAKFCVLGGGSCSAK